MSNHTLTRATLAVSALVKGGVAALLLAAVVAEPLPVSDAPLQPAPVSAPVSGPVSGPATHR